MCWSPVTIIDKKAEMWYIIHEEFYRKMSKYYNETQYDGSVDFNSIFDIKNKAKEEQQLIYCLAIDCIAYGI